MSGGAVDQRTDVRHTVIIRVIVIKEVGLRGREGERGRERERERERERGREGGREGKKERERVITAFL